MEGGDIDSVLDGDDVWVASVVRHRIGVIALRHGRAELAIRYMEVGEQTKLLM